MSCWINYLLVSSTNNNSLDPDKPPTKCWTWSGSKLFDTIMVFLKQFFKIIDFEKIRRPQKKQQRVQTLCLPVATSAIYWQPLQTVWTQVRPDKMLDLIWIQTVWHYHGIPETIFRNNWFWKNQKTTKKKTAKSSNSLPASGDFCHLLTTFAISLDPGQARQNFRLDLDPNCLTL